MKSRVFCIIYLMITLWGAMTSCSEDNNVRDESPISFIYSNFTRVDDNQLKGLAHVMAELAVNPEIVSEVVNGTSASLESGLDEQIYFNDILGNLGSKATLSAIPYHELKTNLLNYAKRETKAAEIDNAELLGVMYSNDLELYWPYSETCDRTEIPAVTFAPVHQQDTLDKVEAYRVKENGDVEIIDVNEEYAKKHPVWVVRLSEIPYGSQMIHPNSGTRTTVTVHTWNLDSLQCCYQYDSWLLGGPDFRFTVTYPKWTDHAVSQTTEFRCTMTRRQVNDEAWIRVGIPFNSDWTEEQVTNHLAVIEEDRNGGTGDTLNVSVKLELPPFTGSVSSTIHLSTYDVKIMSEEYARTWVFDPSRDPLFTIDPQKLYAKCPVRVSTYESY